MKTKTKLDLIQIALFLFLMLILLKITINKEEETEDTFEIIHRSQYESDPVFEGYPVYHELRR
jgi:hypothetical protein